MRENFIYWKLLNKCRMWKKKQHGCKFVEYLLYLRLINTNTLAQPKHLSHCWKSARKRFVQDWNQDEESKYEQVSNQNEEICVNICLWLFSFAAINNQLFGTLLCNILSLLRCKRRRNKGITHNNAKNWLGKVLTCWRCTWLSWWHGCWMFCGL